ncbi:hypothetical protein EBH_0020640 [Eimeria brunetti]|uniref:Uncharacterized protein n=1 Tax=Eimeria brunetti TaxID=51314 RepID=U6LIZ3_9EIME|nr:hypothetical protein EBH_0020640 [Eimeria brunetti]
MQLLGSGDSAWESSPEEVVLPVTLRGLRERRNRRFGWIDSRVAALVATAAVAVAYLVLRCVLYLTSASKRTAPRFLAGADGTTNKDPEVPCSAPSDGARGGATGAAADRKGREGLDGRVLLERANRQAIELKGLIEGNRQLFLMVERDLRANCMTRLLCLCLVEFAALFSLVEGKDRVGIIARIYDISKEITVHRDALSKEGALYKRRRHLRFLHTLFDRLPQVGRPATALGEQERLVKMKELLSLQEVAVMQVQSGLSWLNKSLQPPGNATDEAKAAATATKGAAVDSRAAAAAYEARVTAAILAIERTVHQRRDQIITDPLLSHWLREVYNEEPRYGIMSSHRFAELVQSPLQPHSQLLEALQATPLGSGVVPWEWHVPEDIPVPEGVAFLLAREAPSGGDAVSPPTDPTHRRRRTQSEKAPRLRARKQVDANGSTPVASVSAPPSTLTAVPGVLPSVEAMHASVDATSTLPRAVTLHAASSVPSQAWSAAAGGYFEGIAASAAPRGGVSPGRTRAGQATWAASGGKVAGVSSSGKSLDSPLSQGLLPISAPSSFRGAVSSVATLPSGAFGLSMPDAAAQPPVASFAPETSWVSQPAPSALPAAPATYPPPPAFAAGPGGFGAGAGRTFHGIPVPSPSQLHATPTHPPSPRTAGAAWPPQVTREGGSGLHGARGDVHGFWASQAPGPQAVLSPSSEHTKSHYPLQTAGTQEGVEAFNWPLNVGIWGPLERAVQIPSDGFSNKPPDEAAIDAGLQQLGKLFRGTSDERPSRAAHIRGGPTAAAAPAPYTHSAAAGHTTYWPTVAAPAFDTYSAAHTAAGFEQLGKLFGGATGQTPIQPAPHRHQQQAIATPAADDAADAAADAAAGAAARAAAAEVSPASLQSGRWSR